MHLERRLEKNCTKQTRKKKKNNEKPDKIAVSCKHQCGERRHKKYRGLKWAQVVYGKGNSRIELLVRSKPVY